MDQVFLDPVNRKIIYDLEASKACESEFELLDVGISISKVIESPSGIISISDKQHYYIRKVGNDIILIILVELESESWRIKKCIKNPSAEFITELLKKGSFTPGRNLP